ncbi:hypothetical protein M8013_00585 [Enterobacteriaceae bacterium H4N4]|uniref:EF-hand domain-containing protein n=1 Tax=Silvania confinis TaxID=2926470 RepID=A0A9J6QD73_9ENTR|nr:hypothetical protein [Silvania confinis]MCU6667258.1 hypothetical protein [Silvania confinis]
MKMVLPVDGYRSATEFMAAMQGSEGDTHWLMKQAEHWHGGIHICNDVAGSAVLKPGSHGLKCLTDGQVVAWRLNDVYQTAAFGKKTLKFSSTFVLIKSTCTPDKAKPDNALDFYTLWMQIAPLSDYGISDTPTATVTASALKICQDNTFPGWIRGGLKEGVNVPRDALRHYEVPQDTHTTLPRGTVVEIQQEASFLLNGRPAPFIFITVVSVPEGVKSGLSSGESGWISGLNKFVKRQGDTLPAWMQTARQHGVFNQVVTVSGEDSPGVKAGEVIGHLSLNERPYGGPQYFCHLEVLSQDARMKDFLANKSGVKTGATELHTLPDRTRWQHREKNNTFVVAGVGGDPSLSTAERYTPESDCRRRDAEGKTWYHIPDELAWMAAEDVERVNQFDLMKRGFVVLEQENAPQSIFQTPQEGWLREVYGRLEALARSETRDMYSLSYREKYQRLLHLMDLNQDGVIDAGELWRFLHNTQPHIRYQVQRMVVKHHSEWLKDGLSALWQAALDEQAKTYPDLAMFNREFINKLVWMKEVPEIRSSEALWHMHPVVFLDALALNHTRWVLGTTSECYESAGKGPGVISTGRGDHGGASYGCYQLSSNLGVVQQYIQQSKYKDKFLGLSIGTEAFNAKWKRIAEEDKKGFASDQHKFIKKTHYDVQLSFLEKNGIKLTHKRAAIHDMIWSTSVQYGPYTNLIVKATENILFESSTDSQIIELVQDYKYINTETKFPSSPTLWPGLKSRASSEKAKLLSLVKANAEIE